MSRLRIFVSGVSKSNDQKHCQLPIVDCQLDCLPTTQIANWQSQIGNDLAFFGALAFAFAFAFFFFLLALADNFGFCRSFAFDGHNRSYGFFLHHTHSRDYCVHVFQNLDTGWNRNIRNVKHVMYAQVGDVGIKMLGDVTRFTTNLDFANNLFEHTLFLANADGFSHETQRHSRFDLLAFNQTFEISMNQAHAYRIDLTICKHHLGCFNALDIYGENSVAASIRSENRRQIAQRRKRSDSLSCAAVNSYRYLAIAAVAPRRPFFSSPPR